MTVWVISRGAIDRGAGTKTGSATAISWRAIKPAKDKKITRFERILENLLAKSDSRWHCIFLIIRFLDLMERNYNEKKEN